jgi:hypothetical protein
MDPAHTAVRGVYARLTAFPSEWTLVGLLLLLDLIWAVRIGFDLTAEPIDLSILGTALIAAVVTRVMLVRPHLALCAEGFALSLAASAGFAILSYLCCALALPLVDHELLAADRALGFDWLYWFQAIVARPRLAQAMLWVYNTLIYQGLYFCLFFGVQGRRARLRELFWATAVAGTLTSIGSAIWPALGTYAAFGMPHLANYLADFERLRAGTDLHFTLGNLNGIVTFPSFHTTMAAVYTFCYRGTGVVGHCVLVLNIAMLVTIPFFGGHYLVDMLAGLVVAAVAIAAATCLPGWLDRILVLD